MKYVRSTLNIFNVMVILTIPAFVAGIGFAGDETITQLKAVFKSCEQVQASKNLSLPLYEEAISCAKAEVEFLGVWEKCLRPVCFPWEIYDVSWSCPYKSVF